MFFYSFQKGSRIQNTSQGHKAHANPYCDPGTEYNSANYKWTTSYDLHTKSGFQPPPPLLTLPIQHTTATHPAPSPTHYHTPPATQYLTTHQTIPFHCTLNPHHSMISIIQPAHLQPLLNPFILLKHLHSHPKHIIRLFPTSSSHLNPTPHTSMPRMGSSEQHKGAQLRMTIILFYGKWCTMYNNNWTTWCRWWVQLHAASWGTPTYTQ